MAPNLESMGLFFPTNFWILSLSIVTDGIRASGSGLNGGCDPGWRIHMERLANGQIESRENSAALHTETGGPAQLTDGFTIETSPAAERWWRECSKIIVPGKLLTFDYGFMDEEKFLAGRNTARSGPITNINRTLRCWTSGRAGLDRARQFPSHPGAGEKEGLRTEAVATQEQFLTSVAARAWKNESASSNWTLGRMRQFQTLTHPEHLGRRFRFLLQARG